MLKTLVKKQLLDLFQTYFIDRKTGKARTIKGTIAFFGLLCFLFLCLGFAFFNVAIALGSVTINFGLGWLYFAIMGLLSIALGLFASVFNTYSSLYLPKDNDLIFSLPIPERVIVISRLVGVYSISLMYSAWIWIPTIIAYFNLATLSFCNIVFPIILMFVIALFITVLSTILGFVVALISSKTKGSNFLKVFLSLFIMVGYYVVYFKIENALGNIADHLDSISVWVKSWLHYIYSLGNASNGNIKSMLYVCGITLVLFGLCFYIVSKSFMKLSVSNDNSKRVKNKNVVYKIRKVRDALLIREYKHFSSVPSWMLNSGLGLLILPVLAIVLIIKKNSLLLALNQISAETPIFNDLIPIIILMGICFIISMNCILASSISMEGKTLWQIKSLPIDTFDIFKSKERMFVQMSIISFLPLFLVASKIFNLSDVNMMIVFLTIVAYIYFIGDFGLMLNIKNPSFNWTNETSVVKQSMSVMISMFGGWVICILLGSLGGYLAIKIGTTIVLLLLLLLFIVLFVLCRLWLKNRGTKIFNEF